MAARRCLEMEGRRLCQTADQLAWEIATHKPHCGQSVIDACTAVRLNDICGCCSMHALVPEFISRLMTSNIKAAAAGAAAEACPSSAASCLTVKVQSCHMHVHQKAAAQHSDIQLIIVLERGCCHSDDTACTPVRRRQHSTVARHLASSIAASMMGSSLAGRDPCTDPCCGICILFMLD